MNDYLFAMKNTKTEIFSLILPEGQKSKIRVSAGLRSPWPSS